MDYNIRLAEENDCYKLSVLKKSVWETTYRGIYPDDMIDNFDFKKHENRFKFFVDSADIDLYVVEVEDKIIGYVSCGKPLYDYQDYKQEIHLFYLESAYQRLGIGSDLFKMIYEIIKLKGVNKFFISCNKYNLSAQKFYEQMGGRVIEIDPDSDTKYMVQIKYHYDVN